LQTYQRESKPIGDVYAQVTQLFRDAPDLLEDFKQFLPESAAHAKKLEAQARSDEAIMNSNIRGEPGYGAGQIAQAQTPRPAAKMPPMGQFDPPSTSKENKKRRAPGMGQIPQPALEQGPSGRGLVQVPNANKVSFHSAQSSCFSLCLHHNIKVITPPKSSPDRLWRLTLRLKESTHLS
jgi:histone deacetylase complex regulatory component SIN3